MNSIPETNDDDATFALLLDLPNTVDDKLL